MQEIFKRRSIRRYTSEPVSDEDIELILKAAMAAPSSGNQQPWHFIVVRDRGKLDAVTTAHPYADMLHEAPAAILVCAELALETHPGYWMLDCSAATQNILLAITSLGLGGVWLGIYPRQPRMDAMREIFGLPEGVIPLSLVALGHPAEKKRPVNRFKPSRVHQDHW